MAKVKFFQKLVKSQGQGHKVKILVQTKTSCHKEPTYVIWKPYLFWFKSYSQG